jgi:hypothetical protein
MFMLSLLDNCPEGIGPLHPTLAYEFTLCFVNLVLANIPRIAIIAYGIARIIFFMISPTTSISTGWLYYVKTVSLLGLLVSQFYTLTSESSLFLGSAAVIVAS